MVNHLNDEDVFEGKVVTKGELLAEGTLSIGAGGISVGDSIADPDSWPGQTRVQVANTTERAAVVAWRAANAPISATNPLLVWRANGSLTGVNEITIDGVNWCAESPAAGDIEMTLAAAAPYGWLLLQGQLLVNGAVNYPALWAAASPALRVGSDLRLPDLRGRVPMGAGTGTGLTLRNLGDLVGAESVALTEAQLAAHSHAGTTQGADRSLNHNHYTPIGGTENSDGLVGSARALWYSGSGVNKIGSNVYDTVDPSTATTLNHLHPFVTNTKGSGQAHPNVQPSAVLNFKVKI